MFIRCRLASRRNDAHGVSSPIRIRKIERRGAGGGVRSKHTRTPLFSGNGQLVRKPFINSLLFRCTLARSVQDFDPFKVFESHTFITIGRDCAISNPAVPAAPSALSRGDLGQVAATNIRVTRLELQKLPERDDPTTTRLVLKITRPAPHPLLGASDSIYYNQIRRLACSTSRQA